MVLMIDWKRKLTSRKLWMSIANFVSMVLVYRGVAESNAERVAALIMAGASVVAYIIAEGLADSNPTPINPSETDVTEDPEDDE